MDITVFAFQGALSNCWDYAGHPLLLRNILHPSELGMKLAQAAMHFSAYSIESDAELYLTHVASKPCFSRKYLIVSSAVFFCVI